MVRFDFTDAHVVVTGGSSGMGRACVRRVVEAGARVSVIALDDEDLVATDAELRRLGATYGIAGVDVSDEQAATS